jgi:uncharacterized protein YecT (DUF1311 family)
MQDASSMFAAVQAPQEIDMQLDSTLHSLVTRVLGLLIDRSSIVIATLCVFAVGLTTAMPAHAQCNPNGTANEVIACIDQDNVATEKQLTQFYARYLSALGAQCQAQFPGGGSGGAQDRAICLQNKLKDEAARIGVPRK